MHNILRDPKAKQESTSTIQQLTIVTETNQNSNIYKH